MTPSKPSPPADPGAGTGHDAADLREVGHYVVTSHPPGSVIASVRCSYLSPGSDDLVVAKSDRLEVRTVRRPDSSAAGPDADADGGEALPVVLSLPVNGRISTLSAVRFADERRDCLFLTTERGDYALISHDAELASDLAAGRNKSDGSGSGGPDIVGEHHPVATHASGTFRDADGHALSGGREAEVGPILAVDPLMRCIAVHVYDGFATIIPIHWDYKLGDFRRLPYRRNAGGGLPGKPRGLSSGPLGYPFHVRLEERTVLSMAFLLPPPGSHGSPYLPQLALLHQDVRGFQHVASHGIDVRGRRLVHGGHPAGGVSRSAGRFGGGGGDAGQRPAGMPGEGDRLRKRMVDGGSASIVAVPPRDNGSNGGGGTADKGSAADLLGGVLILGQRQITYHSTAESDNTRVLPTGDSMILSCDMLSGGIAGSASQLRDGNDASVAARYLLGDDAGRVHLLSVLRSPPAGDVSGLHLETLGYASLSSTINHLGNGLVYVGSQFGQSQLLRILDAPSPSGTVSGGRTDDRRGRGTGLEDTTYLSLVEEHDNLGPIVDFDLRPVGDAPASPSPSSGGPGGRGAGRARQSVAATCSGVASEGSVRIVRNGVGMSERAAVDVPGIKGMWGLRRSFGDADDSFLVQSFVGETRVLGVQGPGDAGTDRGDDAMEDDGDDDDEEEVGALAEVTIEGFDPARSTLCACNASVGRHDLLVQAVEDGVRLVDSSTLACVARWSPFDDDDEEDDDGPSGFITVASANESGQIVVALRGGALVYLAAEEGDGEGGPPSLSRVGRTALDREVSCLDLSPFRPGPSPDDGMDVDGPAAPTASPIVAVGLWDDSSVRLLSLSDGNTLDELLRVDLGRPASGAPVEGTPSAAADDAGEAAGARDMMARSLRLVTMDPRSSSGTNPSSCPPSRHGGPVDMLLVGLGDGRLVSFVVDAPSSPSSPGASAGWSVRSRKEVGLGTQGIGLVPFRHGGPAKGDGAGANKGGGTCVLATGDRPTVVYLAGGGGGGGNPKLSYSAVSLAVDEDDDEEEEEETAGRSGRASSHRTVSVNAACPFRSSLLFPPSSSRGTTLCTADPSTLRLGTIDDIRRLHVTTHRLGMTPRRIAHHEAGRVYVVGCIDSGGGGGGGTFGIGAESNQRNVVRFFDDATFVEVSRIELEAYEMIQTVRSASLSINRSFEAGDEGGGDGARPVECRPYVVLGTAYAFPDEDEPSMGRVIVVECNLGGNPKSDDADNDDDDDSQALRVVREISEYPMKGGIYSICPFYRGTLLVTCGSKTVLCQLDASASVAGDLILRHVGTGHHGHMISLYVDSLAGGRGEDGGDGDGRQLAIVGDLMRSISLVEYHPKHQAIDELARDFDANFCTSVTMLTPNIYMGSEGHTNLFVLRYNTEARTEQARCRLDVIGQYHLGEMANKLAAGSLVMPSASPAGGDGGGGLPSASAGGGAAASPGKHPPGSGGAAGGKVDITVGSQTIYGTVDGTLGSILGLGGKTFAFLNSLQRSMAAVVRPVGDLSHGLHRSWRQEHKVHGSVGFVDGDLVESFLDLGRPTMERVVEEMNREGRWRIRDDGRGFGDSLEERDRAFAHGGEPASAPATSLTVEDVLGAVEEIVMLH